MPETVCEECGYDVMKAEEPEILRTSYALQDARELCASCFDHECPGCRDRESAFQWGGGAARVQSEQCQLCNREITVSV